MIFTSKISNEKYYCKKSNHLGKNVTRMTKKTTAKRKIVKNGGWERQRLMTYAILGQYFKNELPAINKIALPRVYTYRTVLLGIMRGMNYDM